MASFWECFILRMNEEKLVWKAFCERESREIESEGFCRYAERERNCLRNKFFFIRFQNETFPK